MGKRISSQTRKELLEAMRRRYRDSPKTDKARILDEFVALTGYHRKHGVRLLSQPCDGQDTALTDGPIRSRRVRVYDEAVKEALTVMWEASDRICGKRLKAILPELLAAMERHGHLNLDPEVRIRVLRVSAATIDRLLKPIRNRAKSRRKHSRPKKASKEVAVRTFADWGEYDAQPFHGRISIKRWRTVLAIFRRPHGGGLPRSVDLPIGSGYGNIRG